MAQREFKIKAVCRQNLCSIFSQLPSPFFPLPCDAPGTSQVVESQCHSWNLELCLQGNTLRKGWVICCKLSPVNFLAPLPFYEPSSLSNPYSFTGDSDGHHWYTGMSLSGLVLHVVLCEELLHVWQSGRRGGGFLSCGRSKMKTRHRQCDKLRCLWISVSSAVK